MQVVTGWGKHSQGGQPRILPAIVRVLMASGLKFRSEPGNAGVIEVFLPGTPLDSSLQSGAATSQGCMCLAEGVVPVGETGSWGSWHASCQLCFNLGCGLQHATMQVVVAKSAICGHLDDVVLHSCAGHRLDCSAIDLLPFMLRQLTS